MPQAVPMFEELAMDLPPLPSGATVGDVACGPGNGAITVVDADPEVQVILLDQDPDLLSIAEEKLGRFTREVTPLGVTIPTNGAPLLGGPYNGVVACLALHASVGHDVEAPEAESRYELLFQSIQGPLRPGGHCLFADYVGTL